MHSPKWCLYSAAFLGVLLSSTIATATEQAEDLAAPVRLEADGKPIDHGAVWGHAGPCVHDVDGDGNRDLVVGDFDGTFTFYRNVGKNSEPRYESAGKLMAGDEPAKVWIYCCIGSSPQFVDLNGDGHADLITGSYDPGACYWFPGNGDGTFQGIGGEIAGRLAEARPPETDGADEEEGGGKNDENNPHANANGLPLKDRMGQDILRTREHEDAYWESFGSWPFPIDWDADGDLDLVIGSFDGTVWLRENLGTKTEFAYSETPVAIEAAGEPIMVKSDAGKALGHAAVVAADWDGDGLFDLMSGCEDGSVRWFKNTGREGAPTFAKAQYLVVRPEGSGESRFIEPGEAPQPGIRTQVAIEDMNGDGKKDLLMGDFSTTRSPREDLTPEEFATYEELRDEFVAAAEAFLNANLKNSDKANEVLESVSEGERFTDANQEKVDKRYEELINEPEYLAVKEAFESTQKELHSYLKKAPKGWHALDDYAPSHGFVWLYLRK